MNKIYKNANWSGNGPAQKYLLVLKKLLKKKMIDLEEEDFIRLRMLTETR